MTTKQETKQTTKDEPKKVQQIKAAVEFLQGTKKTAVTNVTRFKQLLEECKHKKADIVSNVFNELKKEGVGLNSKGKQISKQNLTQLLSAMLRDVKMQRKGWWSTYTIFEKEDVVGLQKKQN
ncbi:MAG: hypothetical protein ACOCVF_04030 [bacterium]